MSNTIHIPHPPIFSFREILWFLDRNYDDCLYEVGDSTVTRFIDYNGCRSLISIGSTGGELVVRRLSGDEISDSLLRDYVKQWFDMPRDLVPFYQQLANNDLEEMANNFYGLRLIGILNLFEAISWCIIGQQINLSFAYKMKRAFVEAYGGSCGFDGNTYYQFPRPSDLIDIKTDDLKAIQFSRQKADYIINLARFFHENPGFQEDLQLLPNSEKMSILMDLRGIGEWTANYVMMKTFGDMSAVPYGDTGLFQALENLGVIEDRKDRSAIEQFMSKFPGWKSYLTIYLWRSLSNYTLKE